MLLLRPLLTALAGALSLDWPATRTTTPRAYTATSQPQHKTPRDALSPGYVSPARDWPHFTYAEPAARRAAVRDYIQARSSRSLPPLRIMLMGGVASGKGTLAPMLSHAFGCRVVGVGQLLRGEVRAERPRGLEAARRMAAGELLDDEFVLSLLLERLGGGGGGGATPRLDAFSSGWLLDGFPRTVLQAQLVLSDDSSLTPDAVVLIERPDELVKEFCLGRCVDSASGQTYHPVYAPPPAEVLDRLVWRVDDTLEILDKRLADHASSCNDVVRVFERRGVPMRRFDNARSELETFAEIARFVEEVALDKLARVRDELLRKKRLADAVASEFAYVGAYGGSLLQSGKLISAVGMLKEAESLLRARPVDAREDDIEAFCDDRENEGECVVRFQEEEPDGGLLAAVRRCNTYDPDDFLPVMLGDEQVGWVNADMLDALLPHVYVCEIVSGSTDGGANCVRLAPRELGTAARTTAVAALVGELVDDGIIKEASLRNELQDVHPLAMGFVPSSGGVEPLMRLERAAMIHFGVPSYGVHVNGWVRNPAEPTSSRPWGMWVAKRSMSKATYPGLLDQMVAGGQPSGLTFLDNVRKECEEEASLPPNVISKIQQTGLVSYRYATNKGLSTKVLATFDLELPEGLVPICADGEVESFELMHIDEVLSSIREELPLWKPNSALVVIDFAIRHGLVDFGEPGYFELAHMLRTGGFL